MDWNTIPSKEIIQKTSDELQKRNFETHIVETKEEALKKIESILTEGASINAASSTTLNEIGFSQWIENQGEKYDFVNNKVWAENDDAKRSDLRRGATVSDFTIGSVNAITQNGELVAVDASGSRVSSYAFGAKNLILVVGVNKITENLDQAMERIKEYVFPLEDERMKGSYGMGSTFGKWLIYDREIVPNRVKVILVNEQLGF